MLCTRDSDNYDRTSLVSSLDPQLSFVPCSSEITMCSCLDPYNIEYWSNIASMLLWHLRHFCEYFFRVNKHVCNLESILLQTHDFRFFIANCLVQIFYFHFVTILLQFYVRLDVALRAIVPMIRSTRIKCIESNFTRGSTN